jgi:hypothetical protein
MRGTFPLRLGRSGFAPVIPNAGLPNLGGALQRVYHERMSEERAAVYRQGKRMDRTKLVYAAASAGLAVVSGVVGFIIAVWSGLMPPVQGAIIGGAFTVVSAAGAATVVFWQLRRQALNTIAANQHNEAMKLKKEVYAELVEVCRKALDAKRALSSFVMQFEMDVRMRRGLVTQGLSYDAPRARVTELLNKYYEAGDKLSDVTLLQERWEIIDPRSFVFRLAFGYAHHLQTTAWAPYFNMAMAFMPKLDNQLWSVPEEREFEIIREQTELFQEALSMHELYILDFQTEMQNMLLGDMFKGHKVEGRKPLQEKYRTVKLDDHVALREYFENTDWGKGIKATEESARNAISTPNSGADF